MNVVAFAPLIVYRVLGPKEAAGKRPHSYLSSSGHLTAVCVSESLLKLEAGHHKPPCVGHTILPAYV